MAIIAQACNIFAFRLSDAALLGPVRYSWVLFAILFGILFFEEKPDLTTYAGAALVLLGGIWLANQRGAEPVKLQK